jgi:hypothetical protein
MYQIPEEIAVLNLFPTKENAKAAKEALEDLIGEKYSPTRLAFLYQDNAGEDMFSVDDCIEIDIANDNIIDLLVRSV